MKRSVSLALMAGLGLMLAGRVTAQTFTTLHNFTARDGSAPLGSLVLSGSILYGTTRSGGSSGSGTVFAINTDGTGFATLHSFIGSDGAYPSGGLVLCGNTLFGTASTGGSSDNGTVFKVNTDGTGFTNLHSFAGYPGEGSNPVAGLITSGNTLYGTTASYNAGFDDGTVFAINTDGTGFTNLHVFTTLSVFFSGTNDDGALPQAGLFLWGSTLYGTASRGGSSDEGTLFAINIDGTGFTNLHNFTALSSPTSPPLTNSDGANPSTGLIGSGDILYGTAARGGTSGCGSLFGVSTNGTGFTNMYNFTTFYYSNVDGTLPVGPLILSGNTLYGTANSGGSFAFGTVFMVNTDGSDFKTLYDFTARNDGAHPNALILWDNTLYGTAYSSGSVGQGTVFSISLGAIKHPRLTANQLGRNIILKWSTNAVGFFLQSTTNIASPVWTVVAPEAVIVYGQNTVTNPISGTQQFFRLSQ